MTINPVSSEEKSAPIVGVTSRAHGVPTMSLYHYLLCDPAGRVESTQSEDCGSDEEAHGQAVRMLPRQGIRSIEVWQGQRCVDRIEQGI